MFLDNETDDHTERRQFHQAEKHSHDFVSVNRYNKSTQDYIFNRLFYINGLSTRRDKPHTKDLLSTNHRKSIFKREPYQPQIFAANNSVDDVNSKLTVGGKEYASSWAVKIPDGLNITHDGGPRNLILKIADAVVDR